jgi:hypothetical protein
MSTPRIVGWLLVLGAVVFWIGAITPPYRQWMGVPTDEYLSIVGANRRNWYAMHALFGLGTVITLAGLGALHGALRAAGDRIWSTIAVSLFSIGVALWLVQVSFRVTVEPWAAAELARDGQVPSIFPALQRWMGVLFAVCMISGYLALVGYGIAILSGPFRPRWAGWFALVFGLVAVPGFATVVFQPPLMLFVVPFVLGIAVLRRAIPLPAGP